MAASINAIAYGAVIVAAVVLFSIGTPDQHAAQTPATAQAAQTSQVASVPAVAAGGGTTLHSISVDLPDSDRTFPGGAAADAINNNCLACHSAGMVLTQPTLPRATWQTEVDKMRHSYNAPVAAADVSAIVDYLSNLNNR